MSQRRVLMIAHHFPPAGASGSNRALAFARYLPGYGWRPTVVTPDAAWAVNRDESLLAEVPEGLRVVRTRSLEPLPLGEVARSAGEGWSPAKTQPSPVPSPTGRGSVKSNLGHLKRFPDAHLGWLPFALGAARRQAYDVAYSSSGPFTSHLVGLVLKRVSRRPWVAELRDGWYRWNRAIFPDYPAWRGPLERRLESAAIRSADRVILVTERMADAFRCQYRDLPASHFSVVPNGFDPLQFDGPASHAQSESGWHLVHVGALYYGRSMAMLLEAVRRVVDSDAEFARDFHLTLIGTLDAAARAELDRSGVQNYVTLRAQVDHARALAAMRSANALLLVANTTPGAEATVPGKLFEYLAVGRPILAVAPADSSTADVLARTGGGWLAPADDPARIACVLGRAYRERTPEADPREIARFNRRALAGELARVFDQVLDGAPRRI